MKKVEENKIIYVDIEQVLCGNESEKLKLSGLDQKTLNRDSLKNSLIIEFKLDKLYNKNMLDIILKMNDIDLKNLDWFFQVKEIDGDYIYIIKTNYNDNYTYKLYNLVHDDSKKLRNKYSKRIYNEKAITSLNQLLKPGDNLVITDRYCNNLEEVCLSLKDQGLKSDNINITKLSWLKKDKGLSIVEDIKRKGIENYLVIDNNDSDIYNIFNDKYIKVDSGILNNKNSEDNKVKELKKYGN